MTVTHASLEAYRNAVISGAVKTQRDRIFKWLVQYTKHNKGFTRNEIAEYTNIRLSGVCGRISQLISDGYVEEVGEREDAFTKVNSKIIAACVPEKGLPQMTLKM